MVFSLPEALSQNLMSFHSSRTQVTCPLLLSPSTCWKALVPVKGSGMDIPLYHYFYLVSDKFSRMELHVGMQVSEDPAGGSMRKNAEMTTEISKGELMDTNSLAYQYLLQFDV